METALGILLAIAFGFVAFCILVGIIAMLIIGFTKN